MYFPPRTHECARPALSRAHNTMLTVSNRSWCDEHAQADESHTAPFSGFTLSVARIYPQNF
eukprot:7625604-Pyramimonas_sp.AAC.1